MFNSFVCYTWSCTLFSSSQDSHVLSSHECMLTPRVVTFSFTFLVPFHVIHGSYVIGLLLEVKTPNWLDIGFRETQCRGLTLIVRKTSFAHNFFKGPLIGYLQISLTNYKILKTLVCWTPWCADPIFGSCKIMVLLCLKSYSLLRFGRQKFHGRLLFGYKIRRTHLQMLLQGHKLQYKNIGISPFDHSNSKELEVGIEINFLQKWSPCCIRYERAIIGVVWYSSNVHIRFNVHPLFWSRICVLYSRIWKAKSIT